MTLPRPKAVLFDWDNTLIDNWGAIRAALNAAMRETFPEIFGAEWERARAIFYKSFEEGHLESLRVLPGAAELLAAIDVKMAVVSNKQGRLLRREAEYLGWAGRFHRLIGAGDAARDKPDPAPFGLAKDGLELREKDVIWYVGDTGLDMQAAHASSCAPILVGNGMGDDLLLERYPPALRVPDLGALLAIWRGL